MKAERAKTKRGGNRTRGVPQIIAGLAHEMRNNLQVINMGLDLMRLGKVSQPQFRAMVNCVERSDKSIEELWEYFLPSETQFSKQNLGIVLRDVIRCLEKQLNSEGIHIHLFYPGSLPFVHLDSGQFRKVLERVMQFSRALLPQGGEIEITAGQRKIRDEKHVELKITTSSNISLAVEEREVFRPFLRLNGYQVGLSIELAHQILRRHRGKIFFQKESPKRGQFTILLKVGSD